MNVVLSWSKQQSKTAATVLHEWLPKVVPGLTPWMSSKDIAKGQEWFRELQGVLEQTRICIVCLTPENVRSPWIYYEAGAIATNGHDVLICPYLVGISPYMLADGPLGQRQCTVATRDDTWELVKSLNRKAPNAEQDLALLENVFQAGWPYLESKLQPLLEEDPADPEEFIATDADRVAGVQLTSESRTMILEVSKDEHGMLLYTRTSSGTRFQTRGHNLCPDQSARTVAKWKSALNDLVTHHVLEPRGHQGQVFVLTATGFEIADAIEHSQ